MLDFEQRIVYVRFMMVDDYETHIESLVRVCQIYKGCAKSLKCQVFLAFSNTFDPNVHKNGKTFGRY